ncbi:unnamed protein product, partial [Prorocentrum cordatum]
GDLPLGAQRNPGTQPACQADLTRCRKQPGAVAGGAACGGHGRLHCDSWRDSAL